MIHIISYFLSDPVPTVNNDWSLNMSKCYMLLRQRFMISALAVYQHLSSPNVSINVRPEDGEARHWLGIGTQTRISNGQMSHSLAAKLAPPQATNRCQISHICPASSISSSTMIDAYQCKINCLIERIETDQTQHSD